MVVALKQMHIAGPKMGPTVASRLAVQQSQHKNVVFLVSLHDGYNKFGWFPENMDFCPQKQDFFAQKSAFYYAAPMLAPLFWARPDPNQWDHKFSILWGTLDAFGFSVDAHSASWRAVLCLQFPKMTLFGAKTCCLLHPKCCDLGNNKTCTGKNTPQNFCVRLTHEERLH